MKINFIRFNIVLLSFLLALSTGCQSMKKKNASTFRIHIEASDHDPTGRTMPIEVGRDGMIQMYVEKQPFLDEGHVAKASVVRAMGAFQIMVEFNRQGTWVLEQYTTASRGRRMAIFTGFGKETRWLAAPRITKTIKDGVLVFTADATMEEAQRIVKGLNDVAKKLQKNNP